MTKKETTWSGYYNETAELPPHQTLITALSLFDQGGTQSDFAVDLGCGNGRDTVLLLHRGWHVLAIDKERAAIDRLRQRAGSAANLETCVGDFGTTEWPNAKLVNAGLALPFFPPDRFDELWARIESSVETGGRFAGHFFGERDDWAVARAVNFHTEMQFTHLFARWKCELMRQVEWNAADVGGRQKHWHVWEVVAQKD